MPKVQFTEEFSTTDKRYPKLFLKKGETARVVLIDQDPYAEFIHTFRTPVMRAGKPVMKVITTKRGTEMELPDKEWIATHLCLGDYDTVAAKKADPERCPGCKAAKETEAVDLEEQKVAVHLLRYNNTDNDGDVKDERISLACLGWAFKSTRFDEIVKLQKRWGNLRKYDLLLECTQETYQNYDIQVAPGSALYLKDEETKNYAGKVFQDNKAEDITEIIAMRATPELMQETVDRVIAAHREAFGGGFQEDTDDEVAASLSDATPEVDDVFDSPSIETVDEPVTGKASDDDFSFDDLNISLDAK